MKQKQTLLPAVGFVCSLAVYLCLWLPSLEYLKLPWSLLPYLRFALHVVPAFFLQLFLLRATRNKFLRAIPLLLTMIPLSFALFFWVRNRDWDRLGALIFVLLSIAPLVGCALGFGVYSARRRNPD